MAGSNESRPAGQPQNEPPQHPRDSHEMPPHYVPNDICASPAPLESPSESVPPFPRHAHTEPLPDRRRSVQLPGEDSRVDTFAAPARKSMQTPRTMTTDRLVSRDFDLRLDGPFGRPSLTMARRRSSAIPEPRTSLHVRRDQIKSAEKEGTVPVPSTPDHQTDEGIDLSRTEDSASFEPEPPPLNYSLRIRTWAIVIFWSLILIDCIAMPIALYFALTYHTSLSPNTVFSIVTAALGGVSILEYFVRFWRLFKKDSTCRVIGARRMYLDWFHWNFSFGWVIIMIELIVGTVPENPPIRLLAMPIASMLYAFGTELLIVDTLRYFKIPAPIRISSIPKGSQLRPGIYSIIEDVCAVDGSGGTAFREALNRRYEASHVFRAMLRRLGLFWSVGAQGMAVLLTILIFTINEEAAYVVGWAAPFIWAGIWTVVTFAYVKYKLREERKGWAEEVATKVAQA